ncbi:MAG: terminase family protein [Gemmataceae bacterium]|nr:terminase family protein [Gemmataceae bacterium]
MNLRRALALALDPTRILSAQGLVPDPWQRDLLFSPHPHLLLNCSRQSGKSTVVAAMALHQALVVPESLVLLVAPSARQSGELFRKVWAAYQAVGRLIPAVVATARQLELANGSRLVALPGREATIRSFSGVRLLILDEAARVPDVLYRSVRPMLAVSRGRLVALSTPFGRRGWFYEEWSGPGPWQRVCVPWPQCPRITPEFIAEETRALGPAWVEQEYQCLFTALEGLVYPDFEQAIVGAAPADLNDAAVVKVGGIDFGWRHPFAAVWGVLDRDDVLWITHERYRRETPLAEHAAALPKDVTWYADPSGGTEIAELRRADHVVRRGDNNLRRGIALVTARLRTGRLKVLAGCTNLIAEARLYRWPTAAERSAAGEQPIDAHNHALAALRYLVTRLEHGQRC